MAKSAEKSLPFFKTLKKCTKKSDFHWTAEAEEAFKQIKQLIAELPMLTAPMEKEELIIYLAAAKETVSAVLMMEMEAKQMPIYFVSRALNSTIRQWKIVLSRHYTLDEETYPRFQHKNRDDMDLFAFIHTPDPTKVKVVERERVKDEPLLLQTTIGRTVPLLLVMPDRADNELETSIDKMFDEGDSGSQAGKVDSMGVGEGTNVQPVTEATDIVTEDVAPLQPKRQRKRKIVVADAGGSSHPPQKLREDHGTPSRPSVAGKSRSASITNGSRLNDGRVCREMVDEFAPPKFFSSVRGMKHD
nr:reverse transcriptase domain-containing protein [Tanacetum cinerariifolium]